MSIRQKAVCCLSLFAILGCSTGGESPPSSTGGAVSTGGSDGAGGGGAGSPAAGGTGSVPACTLASSGPLSSTSDGEVIENLHIRATEGTALLITHSDVVIRNVWVEHAGGVGIRVANAEDVHIENVLVEHTGAPVSGPNPSSELNNIEAYRASSFSVDGARLIRGSSGIYLQESPESELRNIEGHDFRGPFPRGQVVQWNGSDDGLLDGFSVESLSSSWPEDNVNVYQSTNVTIRNGLIDGNNAPNGVGVIFDGGTATGLVEDVDAVNMGNGCFSAYAGADGSVFRRTRCRDNICTGQDGREPPASDSLMWAGSPGLSSLRIEDSTYFNACNSGNIVWPQDSFELAELEEAEFELRDSVELQFCWE